MKGKAMDTMSQLNQEHEARQIARIKTRMPVILLGLLFAAIGVIAGILLFVHKGIIGWGVMFCIVGIGASSSTDNRVIYLNQQKFPDQLTIQYGHCDTDQNSPEYGEFFDFNIDVAAAGIDDPYRLYYDQSVGNVRGRIQIRQIHVT